MPEQKMKYIQRVAEMRDRMAAKNSFRIANIVFDPAAKEAVAAQAEAIRNALQPLVSDRYIDNYLTDHGYIEPKTEDDGRHT